MADFSYGEELPDTFCSRPLEPLDLESGQTLPNTLNVEIQGSKRRRVKPTALQYTLKP